MTGNRILLGAIVVALLQIGFLGWMIQGRASILRNGQEVLLRVEPVDPRDLLRGDYVRLGYEASRFPGDIVSNLPAAGTTTLYDTPIVVRLAKQANGYWSPVAATLNGEISAPTQEFVEIRARVTGDSIRSETERELFVDYGIERFYVPEGEGLEIERNMNVRPFGILAAVSRDGLPQIKGLMDGDVMLFQEPLY